ncbi:MAG: ABC transporter substrate-binding protein [Dehalococcoidales bacterium]
MIKKSLLITIVVIVALLAGAGVSCSNDETPVEPEQASETKPVEPTTVKIGVISDKTGRASQVMGVVDMALNDLVKHFNENEVIPGVRFEAVYYDGQYDPSRDITGYKWLKERGADVIFANLPNTAVTLKPLADKDHMVVFSLFASDQATTPPGWVFCMNIPISAYAKTMMAWVAENDWDWEAKGPAKIGGAGWTGPLWEELQRGAEEYCNTHPEQFQWEGGFLTDFAMTWGTEIDALMDCDYVIPPGVGLVTFAREYRDAGGEAKYLCFESQSSVLGLTAQAAGWESLDGSLFALPNRWWNEDAELSKLANQLLYDTTCPSSRRCSNRVRSRACCPPTRCVRR